MSAQVLRYARIVRQRPGEDPTVRQQRIYDFENGRSFHDFVGDLPEDADALFRPTVTRSASDPHEISAGAGPLGGTIARLAIGPVQQVEGGDLLLVARSLLRH